MTRKPWHDPKGWRSALVRGDWCWQASVVSIRGMTTLAAATPPPHRIYVLLCALRRIGLHDTEFAQATCGTIRLKLLKIGALVRISVRRIKIAMASACPAAQVWGLAAIRLAAAAKARASPA